MAATNAIMIEWGMPITGRETKAMEVFFSAMAKWEEWKSKGKLEGYRVYGDLTGNMSTRAGFAILEGSSAQMTALQDSEEFRKELAKVLTIGDNVRINQLETNDRMPTRMQRYGAELKNLGV